MHSSMVFVYVYTVCAVCVTIFSTSSKFGPVSNFTELHALTQTYAFLFLCMQILPAPVIKNKFGCYEAKIEESEKASQSPRHLWLEPPVLCH